VLRRNGARPSISPWKSFRARPCASRRAGVEFRNVYLSVEEPGRRSACGARWTRRNSFTPRAKGARPYPAGHAGTYRPAAPLARTDYIEIV
jgi:hypothetical protein